MDNNAHLYLQSIRHKEHFSKDFVELYRVFVPLYELDNMEFGLILEAMESWRYRIVPRGTFAMPDGLHMRRMAAARVQTG